MHVEIQKYFDIGMQKTLDHVLVQRSKEKEMDEKNGGVFRTENSYELLALNYFRK